MLLCLSELPFELSFSILDLIDDDELSNLSLVNKNFLTLTRFYLEAKQTSIAAKSSFFRNKRQTRATLQNLQLFDKMITDPLITNALLLRAFKHKQSYNFLLATPKLQRNVSIIIPDLSLTNRISITGWMEQVICLLITENEAKIIDKLSRLYSIEIQFNSQDTIRKICEASLMVLCNETIMIFDSIILINAKTIPVADLQLYGLISIAIAFNRYGIVIEKEKLVELTDSIYTEKQIAHFMCILRHNFNMNNEVHFILSKLLNESYDNLTPLSAVKNLTQTSILLEEFQLTACNLVYTYCLALNSFLYDPYVLAYCALLVVQNKSLEQGFLEYPKLNEMVAHDTLKLCYMTMQDLAKNNSSLGEAAETQFKSWSYELNSSLLSHVNNSYSAFTQFIEETKQDNNQMNTNLSI